MEALITLSFEYLSGVNTRWEQIPTANKKKLLTYYKFYNWLFHDLNAFDSMDVNMRWIEYESQDSEETEYVNYPVCELAPDLPIQVTGMSGATLRVTYQGYTLDATVILGQMIWSDIDDAPKLYLNFLSIHPTDTLDYQLVACHEQGWSLGTWHPLMRIRSHHSTSRLDDAHWCKMHMRLVLEFNKATDNLFHCHLYTYKKDGPKYALNTLFYHLMKQHGFVST